MKIACYFILIVGLSTALPRLAARSIAPQLQQLSAGKLSLGYFLHNINVVAMHRHALALLQSTELSDKALLNIGLEIAFGSVRKTLEYDKSMAHRLDALRETVSTYTEQEVADVLGVDHSEVEKLLLLHDFRSEVNVSRSSKNDTAKPLATYDHLLPDLATKIREINGLQKGVIEQHVVEQPETENNPNASGSWGWLTRMFTSKAEGSATDEEEAAEQKMGSLYKIIGRNKDDGDLEEIWRVWRKELAQLAHVFPEGYLLASDVPQSVSAFTHALLERAKGDIATEESISNARKFLNSLDFIRQNVVDGTIPTATAVQEASAIGGNDAELEKLIATIVVSYKLEQFLPTILNASLPLEDYAKLITDNKDAFSVTELNEMQQALQLAAPRRWSTMGL